MSENVKTAKKRVYVLDTIRGILILGVVIYHFLFDLFDMFDVDLWWMESKPVNFIRDFGAGTFIFIAGISSLLSRNNVVRGIKTLLCALVLSIVTYYMVPDNFIFMGILHFLGGMMLIYGLFGKIINKIPRILGFVVCIGVFICMWGLNSHYIGIKGIFEIEIPYEMRNSTFEYILGFGGGKIWSADYFPFLLWGPLFLAGTFIGNYVKEQRIPKFLYNDYCKPISWLGRNTLIIYLLHQPILYGIIVLFSKLF